VEMNVALSLPRDVASVPVTRQVLDSCLERLGVMPETRADIALALSEACANVIRHAGPGAEYEVIASTTDGRCVIEVVDNGSRDGNKLPPVMSGQNVPEHGMPEHGRGLRIIDAVTDELSLTGNGPAGTTVRFEKVLNWVPGAPAEQLSAAGQLRRGASAATGAASSPGENKQHDAHDERDSRPHRVRALVVAADQEVHRVQRTGDVEHTQDDRQDPENPEHDCQHPAI
jgi:serine/threonine-protein kinase RsbW